MSKADKPFGRKGYGSIGHFMGSRTSDNDFHVNEAQCKLLTDKTRDRYDLVIVQEKLDGSNCSVGLLNGELIPMTRKGYHARTSPFEMHHYFADWVDQNEARFRAVLREGERLCGEWLAQAHGTIYDLTDREPYAVFDIMTGSERLAFIPFTERVGLNFAKPALIHIGQPIPVRRALELHEDKHYGADETEGVVYRMERKGKVDFLAKFVKHNKVDGKYLEDNIWNWKPTKATDVQLSGGVRANHTPPRKLAKGVEGSNK
jgi:hypothetical protein